MAKSFENSGNTKALSFLQYITTGVVLVLFTGFIAMIVAYITLLVDVQSQKQSYQDILGKIKEQQTQQDLMYKQEQQNGEDLVKIRSYLRIR